MALSSTTTAVACSGLIVSAMVILGLLIARERSAESVPIGMAVEFMDHAAAAYVARDHGWYRASGLNLTTYTSYLTGMALASALARSDVQVAYMCLVPAITAHANAGVKLKIVAGTHKYGYALVVNPDIVTSVEELAGEGVRLGCVRAGGTVDMLLERTIDHYRLDREAVLSRVRRMSPPQMLMAINAGQLEAAFLPEHWASMGEELGFTVLLTAQDIWPGLQGSVLVVKEELLHQSPDMVDKLVGINRDATLWLNAHPEEAANTMTRLLQSADGIALPEGFEGTPMDFGLNPTTMLRSMSRLEFTSSISARDVQEVIDYAFRLGYIEEPFPAQEILDVGLVQ
jgi:NitT/TauT family transport system substrate-binding protein